MYIWISISGEPGVVVGFDGNGNALVWWPDLDLGRNTVHDPDSLVLDQAFTVPQVSFGLAKAA